MRSPGRPGGRGRRSKAAEGVGFFCPWYGRGRVRVPTSVRPGDRKKNGVFVSCDVINWSKLVGRSPP